jgi:peptidyl-prolyl cis-trans isomerase SurA
VNGEPITQLDVAHRIKLEQLSSHRTLSNKEALDVLIEDKLKVSIAKRYLLEITDKDVDNTFATISRRAGMPPQQFAQALNGAGVSADAFKSKLRADIAWGQIIRGKFPSVSTIADKDIAAAMDGKSDDKSDTGYQYTLRQVLFIVPRGASSSVYDARRKEAEGLRSRFQNCDEGVQLARVLSDVAVREPIIRTSPDVPAQQRQILDSTPLGRLTPPDTTQQGVEMFAICAKKEILGDGPNRRAMREKLMEERFQAQSKRYMQELRRGAMIEVR